MPDKRVVITGVGPVSAVGIGREAFFSGLKQGVSGIAPIAAFPTDRFAARLAAEIRGFDVRDYLETEKAYLDRNAQLAFAAMSLAIEDANLDLKAMDRAGFGLIFGTAMGCHASSQFFFTDFVEKGPRFVKPIIFPHTYSNTAISLLAMEYELSGYHLNLASGVTASAGAILQAYDLIRTGRNPLIFAGGAESLAPLLVSGYERSGRLSPSAGRGGEVCAPFDSRRNGFILGEGAGMLVLEEAEHARNRGAPCYGEITGGSMGCDLSLAGSGAAAGAGLVRVMHRACGAGSVPGALFAAANGSDALDRIEAAAIRDILGGHAGSVPVTSLKPLLGEVLGADGALGLIAAAGAMLEGFVPPTLNLVAPEPDAGLNVVRAPGWTGKVASVLLNSIDPGGGVVCLAVRATGS
jgi:3-oxoacyl-[acyl-carrier-protein] synthase II